MGDIKKLFGTDPEKEKDGVWQPVGDGMEIKVAKLNNPTYNKRFEFLTKPYRRALRKGTLSNDVAESLMIQCLAETILLDWKGLEEKGKVVKYSVENAIKLLTDYPEFRGTINDIANELAIFQEIEDEEAAENLKK